MDELLGDSLVVLHVADKSKRHAEAWLVEEPVVVGICELPDLAELDGCEARIAEEGDCRLAADDTVALLCDRVEVGKGVSLRWRQR